MEAGPYTLIILQPTGMSGPRILLVHKKSNSFLMLCFEHMTNSYQDEPAMPFSCFLVNPVHYNRKLVQYLDKLLKPESIINLPRPPLTGEILSSIQTWSPRKVDKKAYLLQGGDAFLSCLSGYMRQ